MKKLYLVHCGFYDLTLCDGVYEAHANYYVVADSFEDARAQAKAMPEFKERKMHVDGLQEISAVMGHHVRVDQDPALEGRTTVKSSRYHDLAPKAP
jgi:hypothetical protein